MIPQVFIASGFSRFADPRHYPWTIAFNPSNRTEGHVFAKHVLSTRPDAKIAVLYQNDDLGKDYLNGVMGWPRRQPRLDAGQGSI